MAVNPSLARSVTVGVKVEAVKNTAETTGFAIMQPLNGQSKMQVSANNVPRDIADSELGVYAGKVSGKSWTPQYQFHLDGGGSSDPTPTTNPWMLAGGMVGEDTLMLPVDSFSADLTLNEVVENTTQSDAKVGRVVYQETNYILVKRDGGTNDPVDNDVLTGATSSNTGTVNGSPDTARLYLPANTYAEQSTLTIHHEDTKKRRIANGTMGQIQANFPPSDYPTLSFNGQGNYTTPDGTLALSGDPATEDPSLCEGNSLVLHTVDMSDILVYAFSFDAGSQLEPLVDASSDNGMIGYYISDQSPTGTIEVSQESVATIDVYTLMENGTTIKFVNKHGSGAGERIWWGGNYVQITNVTEGVQNGVNTYQLKLSFTKVRGGAGKFFAVFF